MNYKRIEVPGHGIVEFPDTMSDEEISKVIQKEYFSAPQEIITQRDQSTVRKVEREARKRAIAIEFERKRQESVDAYLGGGTASKAYYAAAGVGWGTVTGMLSGIDRLSRKVLGDEYVDAIQSSPLALVAPGGMVLAGAGLGKKYKENTNAAQFVSDQMEGNETVAKIAGVTAQVGAFVPLALTGPAAPFMTVGGAGLQSFDGTYDSAYESYKRMGFSEDEADKAAFKVSTGAGLITGTVTGMFNRYGGKFFGGVFGKGVERGFSKPVLNAALDMARRGTMSQMAKNVLKESTGEATEEAIDQLLQISLSYVSYRPEVTMQEAMWEVMEAGLMGAYGGTVGGGPFSVYEDVKYRKQRANQAHAVEVQEMTKRSRERYDGKQLQTLIEGGVDKDGNKIAPNETLKDLKGAEGRVLVFSHQDIDAEGRPSDEKLGYMQLDEGADLDAAVAHYERENPNANFRGAFDLSNMDGSKVMDGEAEAGDMDPDTMNIEERVQTEVKALGDGVFDPVKLGKRRIRKADLEQLYGGSVSETDEGYSIKLDNGMQLEIKFDEKFFEPTTEEEVQQFEQSIAAKLGIPLEEFQAKTAEEKQAIKDNFHIAGANVPMQINGETIPNGYIQYFSRTADLQTAKHESIHFLRQSGLMTEQEFQTLVDRFAPNAKTEQDKEEAVAYAFENYHAEAEARRQENRIGVFERIRNFFTKAEVVDSVSGIFNAVERGEVSRRSVPTTAEPAKDLMDVDEAVDTLEPLTIPLPDEVQVEDIDAEPTIPEPVPVDPKFSVQYSGVVDDAAASSTAGPLSVLHDELQYALAGFRSKVKHDFHPQEKADSKKDYINAIMAAPVHRMNSEGGRHMLAAMPDKKLLELGETYLGRLRKRIAKSPKDFSDLTTLTEEQKQAKKEFEEMGWEAPRFKKWFGQGTMVDGNGNPRVLYHGSRTFGRGTNRELAEAMGSGTVPRFLESRFKFNQIEDLSSEAVFLSPEKEFSKAFGGPEGHVYSFVTNVKKTFDATNPEHINDLIEAIRVKEARKRKIAGAVVSKEAEKLTQKFQAEAIRVKLEGSHWQDVEPYADLINRMGYDSYLVTEMSDEVSMTDPDMPPQLIENIAVFDPRNIKILGAMSAATFQDGVHDVRYSVQDAVRGVNVNQGGASFADLIVDGDKSIETRDSGSLLPVVGERIRIIRTGQPGEPAAYIGEVTVGAPKIYKSESEFRADQDLHRVPPGNKFDIKEGGFKWGFPLSDPVRYEKEIIAPKLRGRVMTKPQPAFSVQEFADKVDDLTSVSRLAYTAHKLRKWRDKEGEIDKRENPRKYKALAKEIRSDEDFGLIDIEDADPNNVSDLLHKYEDFEENYSQNAHEDLTKLGLTDDQATDILFSVSHLGSDIRNEALLFAKKHFSEPSEDINFSVQLNDSTIFIPEAADPHVLLPHGPPEMAMHGLFEKNPNPTSNQLAKMPGAPKKRKGKERLDTNVKPTSYAELRDMVVWAINNNAESDWYDRFGRGFREMVGDPNLWEASIVFGITSAQNAAEINLADTLHIMQLARTHDPVNDPAGFERALRNVVKPGGHGKLKVAQAQIDDIIHFYQTGIKEGGLKTTTYMQMTRDRGYNLFNPFSVQDVHMARAFGYRTQDYEDVQDESKASKVRDQIRGLKKQKRPFQRELDKISQTASEANEGKGRELTKSEARRVKTLNNKIGEIDGRISEGEELLGASVKEAPNMYRKSVVDSAKFTGDLSLRYGMYLTTKLANEFNMRPDQIQAMIWFYAKSNLSPKKDSSGRKAVGDGTYGSAVNYAKPEIQALEDMKASGNFDTSNPLNRNTGAAVRPSFTKNVRSDPWSNSNAFLKPILETARKRAANMLIATDPGRERQYEFPLGTTYDMKVNHLYDVMEGITDGAGKVRFFERIGAPHEISLTSGTFYDREPSLEIRFPGMGLGFVDDLAPLMGDSFLQDAVITFQPKFSGVPFGVALSKADQSPFTEQEINELYAKINPEKDEWGLNFTMSGSGLDMKFLDGVYFGRQEEGKDYSSQDLDNFIEQLQPVADAAGLEFRTFNQEGNYHGHSNYTEGLQKAWSKVRGSERQAIQRAAVDDLYKPVWAAYQGFHTKNKLQPVHQKPAPHLAVQFSVQEDGPLSPEVEARINSIDGAREIPKDQQPKFEPDTRGKWAAILGRPSSALGYVGGPELLRKKRELILEQAYQAKAVNTMTRELQDQLLNQAYASVEGWKLPKWMRMGKWTKRLKQFQQDSLPIAAHLNATARDSASGEFTFTDFDMRAGMMPVAQFKKGDHKVGDVIEVSNPLTGDMEFLTIGGFINAQGRVGYQLTRKMTADMQQEMFNHYKKEYADMIWLVEMFIDPNLKGMTKTVGGVKIPLFNRFSLEQMMKDTDKDFEGIAAYTPDVLATRTLSGLVDMVMNPTKAGKAPGRKYKTGKSRESGNVRDLLTGFNIRTFQALNESANKAFAEQVFELGAEPMPKGGVPEGYVRLSSGIDDLLSAVKAYRYYENPKEGEDGYSEAAARLSELDNPEGYSDLLAEAYKRKGRDFIIRKDLVKLLTNKFSHSSQQNRLMRMLNWGIRNSTQGFLVHPYSYVVNSLTNDYFAVEASFHRAFRGTAQLLAKGTREAGRADLDHAGRILGGMFIHRLTGLRQLMGFKNQYDRVVAEILPDEVFENSTALADLKVSYDVGWVEYLKQGEIGAAGLQAIRYGNIDLRPKQRLAYAYLKSQAVRRAKRKGLKGKELKDAVDSYLLNPPKEDRIEAVNQAQFEFLNYADSPQLLQDLTKHDVSRLVLQYPRFGYHYMHKQYDRLKAVKDIFGKQPPGKRADALAHFVTLATFTGGLGGMALHYVLKALAGDDDDDSAQYIGNYQIKYRDPVTKEIKTKKIDYSMITSNRINLSKYFEALGIGDGDGEDFWWRVRNYPMIAMAGAAVQATEDANKFGFQHGVATYLGMARDLSVDMTTIGSGLKVGSKALASMKSVDTGRAERPFFDPYGATVPFSFYITEAAMSSFIPGKRQFDEIALMIDPVHRRRTGSKQIGYDPGPWEAIRQGHAGGAVDRILTALGAADPLPPGGKVENVAASYSSSSTTKSRSVRREARQKLDTSSAGQYYDTHGNLRLGVVPEANIRKQELWQTGAKAAGFNLKAIDRRLYLDQLGPPKRKKKRITVR